MGSSNGLILFRFYDRKSLCKIVGCVMIVDYAETAKESKPSRYVDSIN
jgi:hypothetical protein